MKDKKIRQEGITLVALVITVIVMLILAGVSISILTGDNGLFGKVQRASEETETKNYYVSQESYEGKFGTKPVLSQISGTTGTDRFYVMALEDFNKGTDYNWYYSAYGKMSDYATYTSQDFGTGKANTNAMITKWNNARYGTKDAGGIYKDVWGEIQTEVKKDGIFHQEQSGQHLEER